MVVCADADLERAARRAIWADFMNSTQSCGSIERVCYAQEIADELRILQGSIWLIS